MAREATMRASRPLPLDILGALNANPGARGKALRTSAVRIAASTTARSTSAAN